MRKLFAFATFIFLIALIAANCSKNYEIGQSGGNGTLTLITNTGKTFTASFKNYQTPVYGSGAISKKNTLWFDSYKDPNSAYLTTSISAFFDGVNDIYLISYFKTPDPVLGTLYSGYPDPNHFWWRLDGKDIFCDNPEIIFEEYSNPGRIKGRARGTQLNGTLAFTVVFDFVIN